MSTPGSSLRESLAEYQGSHLLTIAWILIFLAGTFDFGYEKVHCINGFAIECSGIDFTNLLLGGVAACILYFGKYDSPKSEWGAKAAWVACVALLLAAFDGVGCNCPPSVPTLLPLPPIFQPPL